MELARKLRLCRRMPNLGRSKPMQDVKLLRVPHLFHVHFRAARPWLDASMRAGVVVILLVSCALASVTHASHTLSPDELDGFLGRVADAQPDYRRVQEVLGHDKPHRHRVVLLSHHMIDTKEHPAFLEHPDADRLGFARGDDTTEHQYLVHVRGGASEAVKAEISQALGTPLGRYVPKNTYLLVAPPAVAMRATALPLVGWVGAVLPEHRLSAAIVHAHREWAALSLEEQREHSVAHVADWVPPQDQPFRQIDHLTDALLVTLSASAEAGPARAARVADELRAEHPELSYKVVPNTIHADVIVVSEVDADARTGIAVWLAHRAEVAWVEPEVVQRTHNSHSRYSTQSGEASAKSTPIWDAGIHGEGQVIAVGDTGIDTNHCEFNKAGKVKSNRIFDAATLGDDPGGHGSHVAGSAAGFQTQGGIDGHGAAYEAAISFSDIGLEQAGGTVLRLPPVLDAAGPNGYYQHSHDDGAFIHTNSWGASTGVYSETGRATDNFMYENANFLTLFSAGNSGGSGPNTIGAPGNAKNVLSIGAGLSDYEQWLFLCDKGEFGDPAECRNVVENDKDDFNIHGMATFSSRGPTNDGRIKPDVVCPGSWIWSADAQTGCGFKRNQGTSMSCPTCAGVASLMRQYLAEGWYPYGQKDPEHAQDEPDGVLVKTMMVNSGVWMKGNRGGQPMPNSDKFNEYSGYGRVEADEVLFFDDSKYSSYLASNSVKKSPLQDDKTELGTGESTETCVNVDDTRPLRVSICWMDPAGGAGQSWLINDLDLIVTAPDGSKLYGNEASQFNGDQIGANAGDRLNTCEKVVVDQPEAGEWCITVKAVEVNQGNTQAYAMVASGGGNLSPGKGGLGFWAIVAIVLGILSALGLVGAGVVYYRRSAEMERTGAQDVYKFDKTKYATGTSNLTGDGFGAAARNTGISQMTAYSRTDKAAGDEYMTGATAMTYNNGKRSYGSRGSGGRGRNRSRGGSRGGSRSGGARKGSRGGRSYGSRGGRSNGSRGRI